jgi:type II secretory pathway pseudopilin PulG
MKGRRRNVLAVLVICVLATALLVVTAWGGSPRERRRSRVESQLKNAATAEESYAVDHEGNYTRRLDDLKEVGFDPYPNVSLLIPRAGGRGYCLEGQHEALGAIWHYDSDVGTVERGRC